MACQGIPLATKGIIYCPKATIVSGDTRCVLPFKIKLNRDLFNLNLKKKDPITINSLFKDQKINILFSELKVNNRFPNLKINLKKCKD